jgi:hypothetical protein
MLTVFIGLPGLALLWWRRREIRGLDEPGTA